jgi:hypothetical protein
MVLAVAMGMPRAMSVGVAMLVAEASKVPVDIPGVLAVGIAAGMATISPRHGRAYSYNLL